MAGRPPVWGAGLGDREHEGGGSVKAWGEGLDLWFVNWERGLVLVRKSQIVGHRVDNQH